MEHYLDNAATTMVVKAAADEAYRYMVRDYYNPSSLHKAGTAVFEALCSARRLIGCILSVDEREITFTSGGTEAVNTAVCGALALQKGKERRIVTTSIEHAAVLNTLKKLEEEGAKVTFVQPERDGSVDIMKVQNAVDEETALVCMMAVNNETGARLPVEAVKNAISKKGSRALFFCDMVQSIGKTDIDIKRCGIDLASMSAHKIGAPKGAGILYIRDGIKIKPLIYGGNQERGMRSGTENVPAIMAFSKALEIRDQEKRDNIERISFLNRYLREGLLRNFPNVRFNSPENAVPHILNISIPGTKSEVVMRVLEGRGVFVSNSSACSKGKRSHVLSAMDVKSEYIDAAIRISFCPENNISDVDALLGGLSEGVGLFEK